MTSGEPPAGPVFVVILMVASGVVLTEHLAGKTGILGATVAFVLPVVVPVVAPVVVALPVVPSVLVAPPELLFDVQRVVSAIQARPMATNLKLRCIDVSP